MIKFGLSDWTTVQRKLAKSGAWRYSTPSTANDGSFAPIDPALGAERPSWTRRQAGLGAV
ncbi:hypothetical protein PATSB16_23530 [Pandoraea thiooxydans]|nr:hypothetical protein PATSB16_23530 [Pandoraea thiooxydans]